MSNLSVSLEAGFSKLIANPAGIPVKEASSEKVRKEHRRWKNEVQQIKKDKSLKGQSYWQIVSTSVAL